MIHINATADALLCYCYSAFAPPVHQGQYYNSLAEARLALSFKQAVLYHAVLCHAVLCCAVLCCAVPVCNAATTAWQCQYSIM